MPWSDRSQPASRTGNWPLFLGLLAILAFFVGSGILSYRNAQTVREGSRAITRTHTTILALSDILSLLKDAETGQRGYVLTGEEKYLVPHTAAVEALDVKWAELESLFSDPELKTLLTQVRSAIDAKMYELGETIALRRNQGFDAALAVVQTDRGKRSMDVIRNGLGELQRQEERIRADRLAEVDAAYRSAVTSIAATALTGATLGILIYFVLQRAAATRRRQFWLQAGEAGVAQAMLGEQRAEPLGDSLLRFLAEYCGALAGIFYMRDGEQFRRVAVRGADIEGSPERFSPGDGLLAQVAREGQAVLIDPAPEGYLRFSSGLGAASARYLAIAPAKSGNAVAGIVEFAFLKKPAAEVETLLSRISDPVAVAIRAAAYRAELQEFLEETQRQSEELQAQSEELRVSNEELEEQGRALRESQSRLEQQQAELEQTNQQLSEQADMLERQRDDLARAGASVQQKADELARSSQYKSDFLANMSHELRTPLNSSLILAKLLADNKGGNLSAEQVKYAETIQASGNDLLSLINDILDLSKIEAGHMELRPETVYVSRLLSDMGRVFEPLASQKGLRFVARAEAGVPEAIETDSMRVEQVLKNLCSNAIKFTETGSVELLISAGNGRMRLSVTDTGIGIPQEQQDTVFAAFRQADGTISRKYGGTGLGLSISRELARLLGGSISLASTVGEGSVFTLDIPLAWHGEKAPLSVAPPPVTPPHAAPATAAATAREAGDALAAPAIPDDRDHLSSGKRAILVVEDDESFARILYDLTHELGFQCLIAANAESAVATAKRYRPSAVLLDIGLPDHSGLTVLDRLKNDMDTRHIPVHVVSAEDYTQAALALGAVGYMTKPVKREELAATIEALSERLSQTMRRVLIVEDDTVQREAVRALLAAGDVETVGVGSAAECLAKLKETTFDCMVLDLSLPDASGYALLETLSKEDAYSFPPVIVYTGQDLSQADEQKLRRYSKSIIIKGARSPERLIDEVSLFLHQVVSELSPDQRRLIEKSRGRDAALEGKHILVVEDDVRNVYALTSLLEPQGVIVKIARNGREALDMLDASLGTEQAIDLVLMDVMMPEMDGLTATREIRKRPEAKRLPVIMLTAKAMKGDQQRCFEAGANDYMSKPLDVEKLLSLVRVWIPR